MRTCVVAVLLILVAAVPGHGMTGLYSSRSPTDLHGGGYAAQSGAPDGIPSTGVTRIRLGPANLFGRATFELAGGTGFVTGAVHDYRVRGLWLELNQVAALSDKTDLVLTGSYLFPSMDTVSEDYELLFGLRYRTRWSTRTQLWTAGGALAHRLSGPLTLAVGYSFNSFDLSFKSLESASGAVPAGFLTPESSVEVDAHTPYVGLLADFRSSTTSMNVGILWCPRLIGNLNYLVASPPLGGPSSARGPFRHTYFAGLVGEYSQTFSLGHVGVFGRWFGIPGSFDLSFEGAPIQDSVLRISADFWVVGVQAVMMFGL